MKMKLPKAFSRGRFRFSLPLVPITYEFGLDDLADPQDVDQRIARLADIKRDLEAAIEAVDGLQADAQAHKAEVGQLEETIRQLQSDKQAAESMLRVPQDSVVRLVSIANSKGRLRGMIEGIVIGLATGFLSSLLVWYLTT